MKGKKIMSQEKKETLMDFFARRNVLPLLYFPQINVTRISVDQDDESITHVFFTAWGASCSARIRTYNVPEELKNGISKIFSVLCIVDLVRDQFYQEGFGDSKGYNKKIVQTQDLRIVLIEPSKNVSDIVF